MLSFVATAQDSLSRIFSIDEIFELTLQHSQSLKISTTGLDIAKQRLEITKSQRLPSISTSITAGYLGNALLIDNDFSNSVSIPMPHFANAVSLQANQLLYKGNAINNSIAASALQQQITMLALQENILSIKFLVAGNFFDLHKLYNQRKVYDENLKLTILRLKQITKLYDQGMVTRNDVIRSELQIANIKLTLQVIDNNINIINKQLTTVSGIPEEVIIIPDVSGLDKIRLENTISGYQSESLKNYPVVKLAEINVALAQKGVSIAKSDRVPSLSAYANNNMVRPVASASPALDKYSSGWQVGLNLSFNVASLYNSPRNIKLTRLQLDQAKEQEVLVRQNRSLSVNTAYVKYREALSLAETLKQNVQLSQENYRIIEKKYLNQLALFIDMLDASNVKLDAELQHTNAAINVLYTYYQLQKETGNL
jgi:outer membrane protein